jgi:hypothetical protein
MKRIVLVLIAALALPACAEMTGTQKGAVMGGGTGAVAGAIIGNQVSGSGGTGAIIGALGGAAAGALIGDAMEKQSAGTQQGGRLYPVAPPGQPGATPAPPPPGQASVAVPGQYGVDPTRGQLVNGTPYRLQVFVDIDPAQEASAPYLAMHPHEVLPVNLDVGSHRVVAIATRETQFGPRAVGRYDRQLKVDVRGSGWELRFRDGDFQ